MSHSPFKKFIYEYLTKDEKKDYKIKISKEKGIYFAEKIRDAVMQGKKIFIYGDYDVDGIGSTVFMKEIVETIAKTNAKKAKCTTRIPSRAEHYGMKYDYFKASLANYDLIITVDNGTHHFFFDKLTEKEKEKLLIVDHHANGDFQKEKNVINPNIDGKISISTGILLESIFQCVREIDDNYAKRYDDDHFSDLVALTLISDMANKNNKTIRGYIKRGIKKIEQRERIIYQKFFPEWQESISAEDIAFGLIPLLNSVGRIGLDLEWVGKLLSAKIETEQITEYALQLIETNEQRKEASNYYSNLIERQLEASGINLSEVPLLYIHNDEVPIGLNGLIAGNLASKYNTNAIFTSINYGGDLFSLGSGRGDGIKKEMLRLVEKQSHLEKHISFGGHLQAIGLQTQEPEVLKNAVENYNKTAVKKPLNSGKFLIDEKIMLIDEYRHICEEYQNICGVLSLNDSFFVTIKVVILGFDNYRNNFKKILLGDDRGKLMEIITKEDSSIDYLQEDFIEVAIEVKSSIQEDEDTPIFTTLLNAEYFMSKTNKVRSELRSEITSEEENSIQKNKI